VQLEPTADTVIPFHEQHFDEPATVINRRLWGHYNPELAELRFAVSKYYL
jgi:hypothetical protein